MIVDLLIGIVASLIASGIVGFLGNKAIAKNESIILKIYILFLAMTTFIVSGTLSIILNSRFLDRVEKMSEVNTLRFYTNCIHSFVLIFLIVAVVSGIIIGIEAYHRSEIRKHKELMEEKKQ